MAQQDVGPLLPLGFSQTIARRLNRRLVRVDSGCLEWRGSTMQAGHGHISRGSRGSGFEATHRVAWMLVNGPIPEDMFVCHHCDNPPCCEPTHLFLGTAKENTADMWSKGRQGGLLIPPGEAHPDARLTDSDVRRMREQYPAVRNYAALGRMYGISKQHARAIVLGMKRAA